LKEGGTVAVEHAFCFALPLSPVLLLVPPPALRNLNSFWMFDPIASPLPIHCTIARQGRGGTPLPSPDCVTPGHPTGKLPPGQGRINVFTSRTFSSFVLSAKLLVPHLIVFFSPAHTVPLPFSPWASRLTWISQSCLGRTNFFPGCVVLAANGVALFPRLFAPSPSATSALHADYVGMSVLFSAAFLA